MTEPSWAIVRTLPQAEEIAERSLRMGGYRAYLPRYRRLLLPHGSHRRATAAMRPVFQGIVFAQDWRGWPVPMLGSNGLMRIGSRNATLSPDDIAKLQAKELAGEFDDIARPPANGIVIRDDIAIGDDCEVKLGGLRLQAKLVGLSNDGRVTLDAMIFDRVTRISAQDSDVHAISA